MESWQVSRRRFLAGVAGVAASASAGGVITALPAGAAPTGPPSQSPGALPPDVANDWIDVLYDVVLAEGLTPPNAARVYNYCTLAMYEAAVAGMPAHRSLGGQLSGLGALPLPRRGVPLDWPSAVSASVATVAGALFADASVSSRARIADAEAGQTGARRAAGVPAPLLAASREHGRRVGEALVGWLADDGFAGITGTPYAPPVGPDRWRSTPPNFGVAIEPHWGRVRPMVLRSALEVEPEPHVAFSVEPGSAFHDEALATYEASRVLTDEHRRIARFWTDNPRTSGLPSGHWLLIVTQVSRARALRLDTTLEAYARAGVALHDAFLNCWAWKYRINLVRPVSYILDHIDPGWSTFVNTPQFPEYTSGHSVASRSVATVLSDLLGTVAFTDESHLVRGMPARHFSSFFAAADEAAQSRLYGGIHFPMGIEAGKAQGDQVGALVVARLHTRR
ncbi:MAG: vanadium-dependent haloperoxidase [Actinobacteria bacterium]|nr:vanadium-dependent haloperoxidase [Actinomycetota bacterium]